MKDMYYQIVNFFQTMPTIWFITIWIVLFAGILLCIMKFFKAHDGKQQKFEKVSMLVLAIIFIALLIYLTYIRH